MISKIKSAKRILIIGESGRGKTTLAKNLSKKLDIPFYSTDDFLWKVKFSERNEKEKSIKKIKKIYNKDRWIMEGGSLHLFQLGIEKADIIFNLRFKDVIRQWRVLIKRSKSRDYEKLKDLIELLIYVTRKRFGIKNNKEKIITEGLKPYEDKIYTITSYKQIDNLIKKLL